MAELTELEFASPNGLRRVHDKTLGKVTLHTADKVVAVGLHALADDAKGMVLHERGPADPCKQTLLHSSLEFEDSNFR